MLRLSTSCRARAGSRRHANGSAPGIRAEGSEKVSAFDDLSLVQLIVERGADALKELPEGLRGNRGAVAETIENNVRRLIIDEQPINPKYYERMSALLDALIRQRKAEALAYAKYLEKIVDLTRQVKNGPGGEGYPKGLNTSAKRALYDNLGKDEKLAVAVYDAVSASRMDDFRNHPVKLKKVRYAIREVVKDDRLAESILDLVKKHDEF